jgi:replicative DNA helicase
MDGPSVSTGKPAQKAGYRTDGDLRGKVTYLPDVHRLLPQSADAEQGVLSSFLISPRDIGGLCVERGITPECFHSPAHEAIFAILIELWNAAKPIDFITLTQLLRDRKQLDQVGGAAFVTDLFTFVPTAANASYYLEIVQEKWILRQVIQICTEYAARSYDEQDNVPSLLDEVEQHINKIARERFQTRGFSMNEQVIEALEAIEKLYERKGSISGLATGFADLDKMTDGMHAGEMFVIAARPSMGKTALAMNIGEHVAVNNNLSTAIFSLEMSSQQLVQRMLCSRARVSLKRVGDGFLNERDFPKLTHAASQLSGSKLFIDDTSALSILELRAKARRLKTQHDIQLIIIDYLQLLRSTSRRAQDNRQLEIAEISSGIKALAKELAIPIIVLAQLNRNPENRSGDSKGRPRLSDLRESGSIEQDADIVGLLVREKYYAENDEDKAEAGGKATLIIAKQRNGPVGDVDLTFLEEYTCFEDRARSEPPGQ